MLLSEFMEFIYNNNKEECNEALQVSVDDGETYLNLQLNNQKWEVLRWLRQFLDGDLELNNNIRFVPKEFESLDGHVIQFQGKKYKLLEVK
jgi:sulfur relay (sulfurtransferase) DsrC/TusE family protein